MKLFLTAAIITVGSVLLAESPAKDFHSMVKETYSLSPCSAKEESAKKQLDSKLSEFWKYVSDNPEERIPLLRKELKEFKGNGYFLYDGSSLLLRHSSNPDDKILTIDLISKVDMCGIDRGAFFSRVHNLGTKGFDIWPALNHIIDTPQFEVSLYGGSFEFEKEYAVLYCAVVTDEKFWLNKMIERLSTEKNKSIARYLISAIAFSMTDSGQKAIEKYASTSTDKNILKFTSLFLNLESKENLPPPAKIVSDHNQFLSYLKSLTGTSTDPNLDIDTIAKEAPYLVLKKDYLIIKETRKKLASKLSNDTIENMIYLSALLQLAYTSKE